jgi:hypothetical protein
MYIGEGGARERLRAYLDTFQLTANSEYIYINMYIYAYMCMYI